MKKATIFLLTVIIMLVFSTTIYAQEKLGLIILAHGSPSPQWNNPVLKIEQDVKNLLEKKGDKNFKAVRVALMEFNEPSTNTVIKDFENKGIDKVYVIPLFIAPSGHSVIDIPTILGLYSDKYILNELKSEGIEIVNTKMNITVGPTLNQSDVIKKVMLDRVKELSTNPISEGIVLLAHGDEHYKSAWFLMCRETGSYICANTGIDYFDYNFVEIGQSFATDGVETIFHVSQKKEKTIVIGIYLSMGVERMANTSAFIMMGQKMETKKMFAGKNIHFAKKGILPDKRIAEWIVNVASEWLEGF